MLERVTRFDILSKNILRNLRFETLDERLKEKAQELKGKVQELKANSAQMFEGKIKKRAQELKEKFMVEPYVSIAKGAVEDFKTSPLGMLGNTLVVAVGTPLLVSLAIFYPKGTTEYVLQILAASPKEEEVTN